MKKNIASVLLGTAIVTLFAGCTKEQVASVENFEPQVFKASIENPATKTTIERNAFGGKILWSEGDIITINGVHYKGVPSENKTFATFSSTEGAAVPDGNGKFVAVYPYNLINNGKLVLNSEQLYQENNLTKVYPMYAVTTDISNQLNFKNILGLVEIVLKGSAKVSTIEISDAEKSMSGEFTVDDNFNAVINDHSSKTGVKLNCNGTKLTEEGVKFYIAIPAETYNALSIKVLSMDGIKWTVTAKKPATIQRSMIYSLEFTPELGSAVHEKVQLWENGPFWATTNIGATKPTDSGLFFSWGNTDGYIWNGTTLEGAMSGYQFVETPWYDWTAGGKIDDSDKSNPYVLKASEDAASVIWGDGWRIPTTEEATIFGKLDSEYDEASNSVRVYSSIDPTKYIEFGLTGYFNGSSTTISTGMSGVWLNKGRGKNTQALIILFRTTDKLAGNAQKRYCGFNIRPVCDK